MIHGVGGTRRMRCREKVMLGGGVAERGRGQAWKTTLAYRASMLGTAMDKIEIHVVSVISAEQRP